LPIPPLSTAVFEFFADESASVLTEYALVLAVLAIACMMGFEEISSAAGDSVAIDTTGFTNTAVSPP
jgi:Flp pilus assembly pilin Flp